MTKQSIRGGLARLVLAAAVFGGAGGAPYTALAGSSTHLTPEHVLVQSDVIILGTVESRSFGWTDERKLFATTEYVIRVDRVLLDRQGWVAERAGGARPGGAAGRRINLSFMGGEQGGVRYHVSGMPTLAAGESAFFFMSASDLRNNAMSPVIGMSEGLYRVVMHNGEATVFSPGGCSGPSRPVDFRFFAKMRGAGATYTPDEFAAEIARALPLAEGSPHLRHVPAAIPAGLEGRVHLGEEQLAEVGPRVPMASGASVVPPAFSVPSFKRWPEAREFAESRFEPAEPGGALEWGQFDNEPDYPIVFNVPPSAWWRNNFIGEQAYWNVYATAVFRFYQDSNNQVGWPNGRFECGFLTNGQLDDLYGRAWNANEVGVCWTRTATFNDRIVEADIAFNPAYVFSNDPQATYADPNVFSIQTVALHELGHAFGRSHSWDSDPAFIYPSVMNYFPDGFYHIESHRVFADDAASIRGAFVPQEVSLTDIGLTLWRMAGARGPRAPFPNAAAALTLDASVLQGNTFFVSGAWVENIGTVSRASTIDWWLDPTPHDNSLAGAFYCSSTSVGSLSRFTGTSVFAHPRCPANVPPGQYYLCGVIAETDAVESNDIAWSQGTIRVDFNPAFGPPVNDTPGGATAVGPGTFTGSTQFATADGNASCGSSNSSPSVWFRFAVPPTSGRLEVNTCGSSFDTVLSLEIRSFNPQTGLFSWQEVACNDDAPSGPCTGTLQSIAATDFFPALGTDNVRIRLSGFNGASGNYVLNVRLVPANDLCANAALLSTGTTFGSLNAAANEGPWTIACGQSSSTADAWYRYRTPDGCNGTLSIDTFGSSFDTVLEFYGFCGSPQIFGGGYACNDDCGGTFQSCLTQSVSPGFEFVIRVARYGGPTGNTGDAFAINATLTAHTNDHCAGAIMIADGTHAFNTGCAVTGALPMPASCGSGYPVNDLWYRYTAPIAGRFRARLCFSHPEALAVYPGNVCPGDSESARACLWSVSNACDADDVDLPVAAGEQLLVRVGGALIAGQTPSPIGSGTLSVRTDANADPRDFNGDGNVDPDDLGDYINCFFGVPPCGGADFNHDGNVDPDDLGDFINAFFA
ncbi:MAG: hypothetical protein AB7K52_11355 [Phycisphaerales bacterium]